MNQFVQIMEKHIQTFVPWNAKNVMEKIIIWKENLTESAMMIVTSKEIAFQKDYSCFLFVMKKLEQHLEISAVFKNLLLILKE